MQIINTLSELRAYRATLSNDDSQTLAFVPTMGNLHQGHLNLVEKAGALAEHVVVSIFVNPMQFGANEDLDKYPRTFEADCKALQALGVAAVFAPTPEVMYPKGLTSQTSVEVPGLSDIICGESRPGHFRGVATVVCKLLNMVQPDVAVFGEKDFQQLQVIRQMVEDLAMDVDIIGIGTARANDGLALSSRNQYLDEHQRQAAVTIYQCLNFAKDELESDCGSVETVQQTIEKRLTNNGFTVDYVEVRDAKSLLSLSQDSQQGVILIAAYLGQTRLIDNICFTPIL